MSIFFFFLRGRGGKGGGEEEGGREVEEDKDVRSEFIEPINERPESTLKYFLRELGLRVRRGMGEGPFLDFFRFSFRGLPFFRSLEFREAMRSDLEVREW